MPARRPAAGAAPNRAARRRAAAAGKRAPSAKGSSPPSARGAGPTPPLTRRARLFRRVMKVAAVRRFYARRLIRFLDKSKKKGRVIPDQLAELDDYLSKVPAKQRRQLLEASLSGELDSRAGRELRRAASRQGRQKGRAGGGQRPGLPPVPGARPRPQ